MAQVGAATPPPEAMARGVGRGMFVAVVIVVAVIMLLAGVEVGRVLYPSNAAKKSSFLVVGTNIPFPPFESYDVGNGTYFGFDIDIAGMIANATGRTLVINNYADFGLLLTTVGSGGLDMAASAITMSGTAGMKRNDSMSFSDPYYSANQAVLVKSSSTLACASSTCTVNDLKTLTVGIQSGTTSQSWVQQYLAPNMTDAVHQVVTYTTVDTEVTALSAASIDAVIIDAGPAQSIAAGSSGQLKVAGTIITGELYGFAVQHGDPQGLVPIINNVINGAKADGTYDKLIHKWFK